MTDPIADMLTRIRNALAVKKPEVHIPYSKIKFDIVTILEKEKLIKKVEVVEQKPLNTKSPHQSPSTRAEHGAGRSKYGTGQTPNQSLRHGTGRAKTKFKYINVVLGYKDNNQPLITHLKRVSKPGKRVYVKHGSIPYVLSGLGIAMISTSGGIITGYEAYKKGVGGEFMCEIW